MHIIHISSGKRLVVMFSHSIPFQKDVFSGKCTFIQHSFLLKMLGKKGSEQMRETDSAAKWFRTRFYPFWRTGHAVFFEEKILERIRNPEIIFFTPWGPRYSWERRGKYIRNGDAEIKTLLFLRHLFDEMQHNMPQKNIRWIFLGADFYGTQINHLPVDVVNVYFDSLQKRLQEIIPESEFLRWSQMQMQALPYRKALKQSNNTTLIQRAKMTAEKMGRDGDPMAYIHERMVEAEVIEELYHPIKISCVPRYKDDKVDMRLPRLYIVPERLHAPWV